MARFGKLFLITLLLLGLLLSTSLVAAGCGEETTTAPGTTPTTVTVDTSKVVGDRALKVMASTPQQPADYPSNSVTAAKLSQTLADPAQKATVYLLDIRSKADFAKGHIEGATNIEFKQLATAENLSKLPKDKKIIIIGYVENTEGQAVMGLRMLGFDAAILRSGMQGWAQTDITQTIVSELSNTNYPVVTAPPAGASSPAPPAGAFDKPSDADYKVLADKLAKILSEMPASGEFADYSITAAELSQKLGSAAEKAKLFVLDVRSQDDFNKGHIEGAINIPFRASAVPANISMLPKDKTIVVVCYTANTAAQTNMILRMLDYDAIVLKYAMMGWDGSGKQAYLTDIEGANNPEVTS